MNTKTVNPRLANKQVVVMRIGRQKLIGKVCNIKPMGKTFMYDVAGEDGKIYYELYVDQDFNHTIDTKLTKLYCERYNIVSDMDDVPITEIDEKESVTSVEEDVEVEDETSYEDEGMLYEFNEDE